MLYNDFTITITGRQKSGYSVSATADGVGRVAHGLPLPGAGLLESLAGAAQPSSTVDAETFLRSTGESLFRWATPGSVESHLRIAWDRADRQSRGLRIRLSIDAPEVNVWPWELLHDPVRDHPFATSISTPLVRFLDQADEFGGLANQLSELPLDLLLIIPHTPDLDLAREQALIEEAIAPLGGAVKLHALEGIVTRGALADALMGGRFDIVHFSGHGGFTAGRGYIALNRANGMPDWVEGATLGRLLANHPSLKLAILNACATGQVDEGRAFQGLAPQLVRRGIPAVVAMQYNLTDQAALTFAREFYRQLSLGENAGQVDLAVTHARNMLAVRSAADVSFAAPVIYTHAPDGVIFRLPRNAEAGSSVDPSSQRARLAGLRGSLRAGDELEDDWALAGRQKLEVWRQILRRTEQTYRLHLSDHDPDVQRAAREGLALTQRRLTALESALAAAQTG